MRTLKARIWAQALMLALLTCTADGRTYIVEVASAKDVSRLGRTFATKKLNCLGDANIQLGQILESSIFNGFSINIAPEDSDLSSTTACMKSTAGVVDVWQSRQYQLAASHQASPYVHDDLAQLAKDVFGAHALHKMTGVDQLHRKNITGEGIKIALIDSGVDYLHPALGGGFGPGYKVSGGEDLVGDDWVFPAAPNPAENPWTECYLHGTHVAGIAVGSDPSTGFVGVAPGAQILTYQVMGCRDSRYFNMEIIMKAILQAYEDRADVISASLITQTGPFQDDPVSMLLTRITEEGRTVCVAAVGNNGNEGPFTVDAPASASGVLSVGYVDLEQLIESRPRARYRVDSILYDFKWAPAGPSRFPESMPLRALNLSASVDNDGCESLEHASLSDAVILVRRGGCPFQQKMQNIVDAGGSYLLIYSNNTVDDDAFIQFENKVEGVIGAGSLTAKTGVELIERLAAGQDVEMMMDSNFTLMPYVSVKNGTNPEGVNVHSSWGASGDANIRPSLVAPGGNILSTLPRNWGGYGRLSGTSMATPYAAGCVALVKQARPDLSAAEIVSLLVSTAVPMTFSDGRRNPGMIWPYTSLASVWQQGGGLINPLNAIRARAFPTVPSTSFNDTQFFTGEKTFTIKNSGEEKVEFDVSSIASASALSLWPNSSMTRLAQERKSTTTTPEFLESLRNETAAITVWPTSFSIEPGASMDMVVRADPSALAAFSRRCPLYGGYILLNTSAGDSLSIPYGGISCALQDVVALSHDSSGTYLTSATEAEIYQSLFTGPRLAPLTAFTIPGPNAVAADDMADVRFPTVALKLDFPSRAVKIDLLASSEPVNSTAGAAAFDSHDTARPGGFSRIHPTHKIWRGRLADGSWAKEGDYKFRVCALRAWGSVDDASAYRDCIATTPFTLRYSGSPASSSPLPTFARESYIARFDVLALVQNFYAPVVLTVFVVVMKNLLVLYIS